MRPLLVTSSAAYIDAKFAPLADNGGKTKTHLLLKQSPAINAGNANIVDEPSTDQLGEQCIRNNIIDLGSAEYDNSISIIPPMLYILL